MQCALRSKQGKFNAMAKSDVQRPGAAGDLHSRGFIEDVLSYFYPAHYRLGMEMEAAMSQGRIGRKQSALLWLIHTRSAAGAWVTRKEIEAELSNWFEISNSKISRMIRELSAAPMDLIEVAETPESGREKMLRLTPEGARFVDGMVGAAVDYLTAKLGHLSPDQLKWGLQFFRIAFMPEPADTRSPALGEFPSG